MQVPKIIMTVIRDVKLYTLLLGDTMALFIILMIAYTQYNNINQTGLEIIYDH